MSRQGKLRGAAEQRVRSFGTCNLAGSFRLVGERPYGVLAQELLMSGISFAATTPISISQVGLKARDADKLAAHYRMLLGFEELSRSDGAITLGASGRPLLVLER